MTNFICKKKTYSKYTLDVLVLSIKMRLRLIKYVDEEKMSTANAARILGIKQTSACRIMRSYHKYNTIFERKADKLKRSTEYNFEEDE